MIGTTKLSENGEAVTTTKVQRDKLGRITRIDKVAYLRGKPTPAQLQVRFEYPVAGFAPVLAARPSVVPAKELVTRIEYNEAGQPLSVTESGWAPTADGKQAAERIERTIRYRYATINGRSLLTEIDGPLPNGKTNSPADSDITVFEYDHQPAPLSQSPASSLTRYERHEGILTAMIAPGNRKSEVGYDYADRITTVKDADGHTTKLQYSPRGELLTFTRDGITHSTRYDALGHPIEAGYEDDKSFEPKTRYGYDDAGRNIWTASSLGVLQTWRFDTESKLLEKSTLSNAIRQTQRYEYNHLGRLQAVIDASGAARRIGWNAQALPDALTDALGRDTHLVYDATGNITAVKLADSTEIRFDLDLYGRPVAMVALNGATTRYVRDDFGRVIVAIGADSGATVRRFDVANRLVASLDANGNRINYEYDLLGRIVRQNVTDVDNAGYTTVTTWRYEGRHLIAIDHPNQAERYDHDVQGRVSAKTVILALADGARVRYTTRYRYDAMGRPAGVILPDGSDLNYQRNSQGPITALERRLAARSWLRWLFPRQTIVENLERDVVGLTRLSYGNGIEAQYQRSREGSLARIVYRDPSMRQPRDQASAKLEAMLRVPPTQIARATTLPGALGLLADPQALLDHRYVWDAQGNLLHTHDNDTVSNYAYDARDRLIVAATSLDARFARYHYDGNGNRLLAQEGIDQSDLRTHTVKASYAPDGDRWQNRLESTGAQEALYDAAGQPTSIGQRNFVWDALGKLREVRDGLRVIARYRYNHHGERIEKAVGGKHTYYLYEDRKLVAEVDGKGRIQRQYIYLADLPIAIIDVPNDMNKAADGPESADVMSEVYHFWRSWFGKGETLTYLHSNHLGAVEMATNANGKPIWLVTYSPFGNLMSAIARGTSNFDINLRLPGQYADKETGLYYNDHRYYDPARGRYLTPDPLGLAGGANGYVYAGGNPTKYIDPEGLVLFAFDGTGNTNDQTWLSANGSSPSNVLRLFDLYADGNARYVSGVGTVHRDQQYGDIVPAAYKPGSIPLPAQEADMGANYSGPARIQRMVQYFNDEADLASNNDTMDVDIVGFSRGAAEARDFANRIIANTTNGWYSYKNVKGEQLCQTVNFRFMGLFDTVLSTNYSGTSYNLGISLQFAYVAQAVALNEHRGKTTRRLLNSVGAFPLESIIGGSSPIGKKRIERGFIGSHADIGGGFGPNESQLSQVALTWMVDQAKAAGIKMTDSPLLHTIIANPVLHDKSDNQYSANGAPVAPGIEDREVRYRDGKTTTQMTMNGARMTWSDTQKFISYLPAVKLGDRGQVVRFPSGDYKTGTVDMQGYLDWLKKNGYNINMKVQ